MLARYLCGMIIFSTNNGLRKSLGYKELAKKYLEQYMELNEDEFMVNMMCLLDELEASEGLTFERIMPSDWNLLLKAVRVLNVSPLVE